MTFLGTKARVHILTVYLLFYLHNAKMLLEKRLESGSTTTVTANLVTVYRREISSTTLIKPRRKRTKKVSIEKTVSRLNTIVLDVQDVVRRWSSVRTTPKIIQFC